MGLCFKTTIQEFKKGKKGLGIKFGSLKLVSGTEAEAMMLADDEIEVTVSIQPAPQIQEKDLFDGNAKGAD